MITTQRTSSIRRRRPLIAAVVAVLAASLLGPSAALADSVSVGMVGIDPTVDERIVLLYSASSNEVSTAYVYVEAGRVGCPSSAGAAATAGMTLLGSEGFRYWTMGDGIPWTPTAEGEYLLCGYLHRDTDTATARATDSYIITVQEAADAPIVTVASTQPLTTSNTVTADVSCPRACSLSVGGWAGTDSRTASVTLGTATATIGTFGGSTTVQVPMTTAQRRELRQRLLAGERVRAELDATSTADNGDTHGTNAATELTLAAFSTVTPAVRVFSGL